MTGRLRSAVGPGTRVAIVLKQDQRTGRTVEGVVAAVLTRSATHPHGIKVRLVDGRVGRVKAVLADDSAPSAGPSAEPDRRGRNGGTHSTGSMLERKGRDG